MADQGVQSRGSGNASYLPSVREITRRNIQAQKAFLRHCFITVERPAFPLLLPYMDSSFGCQLESPAVEHGWQLGEWPQCLWDKTEAKVSKGSA